MRKPWNDKHARRLLLADLVAAALIGVAVGLVAPWWLGAIMGTAAALTIVFSFGAGYFAGQSFVYRETSTELREMRDAMDGVMAEMQQRLEIAMPPLPPPRHLH